MVFKNNSPTNSPISASSTRMQNSPISHQLQIKAYERTINTNKARIDELDGELIEREKTIGRLHSQIEG